MPEPQRTPPWLDQILFGGRDEYHLTGVAFFSEVTIKAVSTHTRQKQVYNQKAGLLEGRAIQEILGTGKCFDVGVYPSDFISRLSALRTDSSSSTTKIVRSSGLTTNSLSILYQKKCNLTRCPVLKACRQRVAAKTSRTVPDSARYLLPVR